MDGLGLFLSSIASHFNPGDLFSVAWATLLGIASACCPASPPPSAWRC
jgi:hypothetical protein